VKSDQGRCGEGVRRDGGDDKARGEAFWTVRLGEIRSVGVAA
jgi:hypothetical protein